jgi:hypothetical protein
MGNRSSRRKPAPAPLLSITKSHITRPGFEPGPPLWEAGDEPPELWRGPSSVVTWDTTLQAEDRGFYSRWGHWIFFNWLNPSIRAVALGPTQPLTEMSTRNLPGNKGRPACKADNHTAICEPIFYKMWEPRRLTTLWASTDCYRDSFTFHSTYTYLCRQFLFPNLTLAIKMK